MRKKISLLLVACLLVINAPFVSAQNSEIISETVKIISYNLTANNHVIEKALASGTLISKDGLILTNNHVVMDENDEPYEVFAVCTVSDTQTKPDCLYTASLVAKAKSTDMAILKINSKDISGQKIPEFPFLSYHTSILPEIGDKIEISGFPGIGGETLTKTEGQVSGYEEREETTHLKTDATISSGNSGGTAKDLKGNFLGVPSYLRSDISSLGYIIPLQEVEKWITANLNQAPLQNTVAINLLNLLLQQTDASEQNQKYSSKIYPFYEISLAEDWEITFLNDVDLLLNKQIDGEEFNLEISTEVLPYQVNADFLDYLVKRIEKYKTYYTNYKRENIEKYGQSGLLITYDFVNSRNYYYVFTFENVLFSYNYQLPLENLAEWEAILNKLLATLTFVEKANNTQAYLQTFTQKSPAVSLKTSGDFYIAPVLDSQEEETIVNIYNPNSFEQIFNLSESYLEKDSWDLSIAEIAKADIKQNRYSTPNFKLINRYDDVVLDGLSGYAYTYSYQGEDYNQTRQQTNVVILNGKKYFRFVYDDLEAEYVKNIGEVIQTLETFQYFGEENAETKGRYSVPAFREIYTDIQYHLYEKQISVLTDKGILIQTDQNFYPEKPMKRIEALEAILNSLIYVEDQRGQTATQDAIDASAEESLFKDLHQTKYGRLSNYAVAQKIIGAGETFASERGITLAETLKILCETFDLPVWNPPYRHLLPWYLPYMYKGWSLGIISSNASFDHILTKGEFAGLLYDFLQTVAEQDDF